MSSVTMKTGPAFARRQKLRKIATAARAVALVGILLVTGYHAYLMLNSEQLISSLNIEALPADLSPSDWARLLGWLIYFIPSALFVAAMVNARTLFAVLAQGSLFDPEIARLLRRIGQIAVAAAVATLVSRTLVVLVMTLGSPGWPFFVIGINTEEITAFVVGFLLLAFSLVMQEAFVIEEENKGFV